MPQEKQRPASRTWNQKWKQRPSILILYHFLCRVHMGKIFKSLFGSETKGRLPQKNFPDKIKSVADPLTKSREEDLIYEEKLQGDRCRQVMAVAG